MADIEPPKQIPFRLPHGPIATTDSVDLRLNYLTAIHRSNTHWTAIFDDWVKPNVDRSNYFATEMIRHAEKLNRLGLYSVFCLHDGASHKRMNPCRANTVNAVNKFLQHASRSRWKSFQITGN